MGSRVLTTLSQAPTRPGGSGRPTKAEPHVSSTPSGLPNDTSRSARNSWRCSMSSTTTEPRLWARTTVGTPGAGRRPDLVGDRGARPHAGWAGPGRPSRAPCRTRASARPARRARTRWPQPVRAIGASRLGRQRGHQSDQRVAVEAGGRRVRHLQCTPAVDGRARDRLVTFQHPRVLDSGRCQLQLGPAPAHSRTQRSIPPRNRAADAVHEDHRRIRHMSSLASSTYADQVEPVLLPLDLGHRQIPYDEGWQLQDGCTPRS